MSESGDLTFTTAEAGKWSFGITEPPRNIQVMGSDGRTALIDFSGEAVTYSGDLPVDESAKIFFRAVFSQFKLASRITAQQ